MLVSNSLSIVIPAFNEMRRLPETLKAIERFASGREDITEVIIVDDGSRDATTSVAATFRNRPLPFNVVSYSKNAGKGYAIRRGVLQASGSSILVTDADLSTPIAELDKLLPYLAKHDVVIGSRALDEDLLRVKQAWYRQGMGKTFNWMMQRITGLSFRDTQCGFKLFRGAAARRIFEKATVDRFAYDVEMLMIAIKLGYSVVEVPVEWFNSVDSRVRIVRDSPRMLLDIIRARMRLGRIGGEIPASPANHHSQTHEQGESGNP